MKPTEADIAHACRLIGEGNAGDIAEALVRAREDGARGVRGRLRADAEALRDVVRDYLDSDHYPECIPGDCSHLCEVPPIHARMCALVGRPRTT